MQSDDPPFLAVGTEVSAKFKGAFCEAKVKRCSLSVKCKVTQKEPPFGMICVDHTQIKGDLELNQPVEIIRGKDTVKGILVHIKDCSTYNVEFNDGDQRQLRRTQLCLKGAKHFDAAGNLDAMPLYNPETFSSPVVSSSVKSSRGRNRSKRKSVCRAEAEDSNIDERRGRARRLEHTESEDSADATEEDSEETSTTYTNQSGSAAERGRSSIASRRSQKSSCHSGTPKPTQVPERLRNAIRQSTRSSPRFGQSTKKVKQENPSESEYAESGSDVEKSKRSVSLRQLSKLKGASSCHRADLSMRKRRKRFAAALAEEALDRSAEANDSNSDDDAEENGDDGDEFEVEKTVDQASGRRYATSRSSSPESAGNLRGRKTVKRMKRGRRRNSDNSVEYSSKERSKDGDSLQNDSLEPGRVVCVYDDSVRKGKWIPAVVVASEAYRNNHKAARPLARSEIAVRRFKDAKYMVIPRNNLELYNGSQHSALDHSSKGALDRATAFIKKGILPMNWEKNEIYGTKASTLGGRRSSSSYTTEAKKTVFGKRNAASKADENDRRRETMMGSEASESSNSDSGCEDCDLFTAQLYKFHEERGTPINKAPILGGKDLDLFRFYKVVQSYGGKKRVTENNMWRKVLSRLHLGGCPGATPVTVRNAYSRYLDHFNSFYRNLGLSTWPTTSTSSRSVRQNRLTDRETEQLRKKKLAERKKERQEKLRKAREYDRHDGDYKRKNEKCGKENQKVKVTRDEEVVKKDQKQERKHWLALTSAAGKRSQTKDEQKLLSKKKVKEDINNEIIANKEICHSSESDHKEEISKRVDLDKDVGKEVKPEEFEENATKRENVVVKVEFDDANESFEQESDTSHRGQRSRSHKSLSVDNGEEEKDVTASCSTSLHRLSSSPANTRNDMSDEAYPKYSHDMSTNVPPTKPSKVHPRSRASSIVNETAVMSEGSSDDAKISLSLQGVPSTGDKAVESSRLTAFNEDTVRQRSARRRERIQRRQSKDSKETTSPASSCNDQMRESREKEKAENYVQATVFTRFRQGQNLRAYTHGQWYEARVITYEQPSTTEIVETLEEFDRRFAAQFGQFHSHSDGQSAASWLNDCLEAFLKRTHCVVHYLGWNSRYDESVIPAKIRVSAEDQKLSEEQFISFSPVKVKQATMTAALSWRSSEVDLYLIQEGITCGDILGYSGFRPHRISHSQQELYLTLSSNETASRVKEGPASTTFLVHDDIEPEEQTSLLLEKDADESVHVSSLGAAVPTSVLLSRSTVPSQSYCASRSVGPLQTSEEQLDFVRTKDSVVSVGDECFIQLIPADALPTSSCQPTSPEFLEDLKSDAETSGFGPSCEQSSFPVVNVADCELSFCKQQNAESLNCACEKNFAITLETSASLTVLAVDEKPDLCASVTSACSSQVLASTTDELILKTFKTESPLISEEISPVPVDTAFRDIGASEETMAEDFDSAGRCTPHRQFHKSSSRGGRRKRVCRNPSHIVLDKKGNRSNRRSGNTEGDIDDSEDEPDTDVEESFHALKLRMQIEMEADGTIDCENFIALPVLDENLSAEDLIMQLQERLQAIREKYHEVKSDEATLERRRRKTVERRKQRRREQRVKVKKLVEDDRILVV